MSSRPNQALLTSALVGPVVAAGGVATLLAAAGDLPAQVAVHWGLDGSPDRFLGQTAAIVSAGLATTVVPLVLAVLGTTAHRSARGTIAGVAGGLAVLLGAVMFGSTWAQRGTDGRSSGFPVVWLLAGLLAALFVGGALFWWGRTGAELTGARPTMPADAARLDVSPTTRLAWTGRAALPSRGVPVTVGIAVAILGWLVLSGQPYLLIVVAAIGMLLLVTYAARVVIDSSGLRVTSLGLTWVKVPLDQVQYAAPGTVSPMRDFGGWGWRIAIDGRRGYVTRAGEALVVHRLGEPDLVVTIDAPSEAAAVLNTLASRVG